ncbi:hypothetical protein ACHHYP_10097 [Achlya hypogyna]|uniref:Rab-GAP TBC domain-containing protein n=1 Tax=Achlya hypogyna TaxID=1202772 RepID=A0A1V9ZIE8_ACHHY|nr:hypothetical protein ACHHYP_10097 [Achlya hypogyna]
MLVALRKAAQGRSAAADEPQEAHRRTILSAIHCNETTPETPSLDEWRRLALTPGGFLSRDLRKRVWPMLFGFSSASLEAFYRDHRLKPQVPGYQHTPHPDDDQVQRDVDRSLNPDMWHDAALLNNRRKRRKSLASLLHAVLCSARKEAVELHYYQGFHDVAAVFLLTTGVHLATPLLLRASTTYFREPMRVNFDSVLAIFNVLYPLVRTQDKELHAHIMASGVDPYFALPWVITWFAHHVGAFEDVCRLYDVLLCSHPLFSMYLSATLILHHRASILACECDYAEMHTTLSKLVKTMPIEVIVDILLPLLFTAVPPVQLLAMSTLASGEPIPDSCFTTFPFTHQGTATPPTYTVLPPALASGPWTGLWSTPRQVRVFVASVVLAVLASIVAVPYLDQM